MANSLCCSSLTSLNNSEKPGLISGNYSSRKANWIRDVSFGMISTTTFEALKVKATDSKSSTKPKSILCSDCEGNGAKSCSQCEGSGVNSVDHFNERFKAGELCWLCRGKKEILCGNCNGAGFIGGFMSTCDS